MAGYSKRHDGAGAEPDGALPEPRFDHLYHMTTALGLWEHADHATPLPEHGFCLDDSARGLIVLLREPTHGPALTQMANIYKRFILDASLRGGGFHNRRRADGAWTDDVGSDDSQGRAIWALGTWFRRAPRSLVRNDVLNLLACQRFESPSPRANAFAVLGASEILAVDPTNSVASEAVRRWASHLHISRDPDWPWPEKRLAYQNARLPEAMIAAGHAMGKTSMIEQGLDLLRWLVAIETRTDHFSFTPVGGWAPGELRPGFDQQPTEAAAMADACARAFSVTGDSIWLDGVLMAGRWLMGANDQGVALYDSNTGSCKDGLTSSGANLNQGAESTLAALSTLQQAQKIHLPNWPRQEFLPMDDRAMALQGSRR